MSLLAPSTLVLATRGDHDASKSGPIGRLCLELLFQIADNGLELTEILALASTNKDMLSKLIGHLFKQGMDANKAPLQWACTKHGRGPAVLDAIVQLHPKGRQLLSSYFSHDDDAHVVGQTPLIVAIRAANFRVVRRLLQYGVDANQSERSPTLKTISYNLPALWWPIHFAVGHKLIPDSPVQLGSGDSPQLREAIVRHLLQNGALDVEKKTEALDPSAIMSPLFLHLTNKPSSVRASIIRQLLRHGAEGNRPSLVRVHMIINATRMVSPLSNLIAQCRREKHVPREVIAVAGLLIRAEDGDGLHTCSGAPLIMECLNPSENMRWFQLTEMLLNSGRQSALAVNTQGEPAVVRLIKGLLDYQLWFNYNHLYATKMEKQNRYDRVRGCAYRMLQLLQHHGADINARCPENHSEYPGATALIVAASIRDELHDVFLDLLEGGADAKARDSKGQTACFGLFVGRLSNPNDRIQALSEAGVPMNAADENGDTVLHYAAENSRRDFSHWLPKLLAHGCDLDIRNHQNETFVDVLCRDAKPDQREATRTRIMEGIRQAQENAVKVKKQEKIEKYRAKVAAAAEQRQKRRDAVQAAKVAAQAISSTGHTSASTAQIGPSTIQAGPNTAQLGPSTAQAGFNNAQVGPSTAQVGAGTSQAGASSAQGGGHGDTSQADPGTTESHANASPQAGQASGAGIKILRVRDKRSEVGSGAALAGTSTAPVATSGQRHADRRNTAEKSHQPVGAGPSTPRSYSTAAQASSGTAHASSGTAQAGSRTVAQAGSPSIDRAGPSATQVAHGTTQAFPGAASSAFGWMEYRPPDFW